MGHILSRKKKGLSPLLATVILIGITVAAGGAVYSIYTGSSSSAASSNAIRVESVSAVKGSNHADFQVTVANVGSTPWKKLDVWIASEAGSRPILYETLHEVAQGTDINTDLENPLRPEAIAVSTDGVGLGLGRKFQLSTEGFPKERTVAIDTNAVKPDTDTDNSILDEIDAKFKGTETCITTDPGKETCTIKYGKKLSEPIAPGQSMRLYADLILGNTLNLHSSTGLDKRTTESVHPVAVRVGDELTVNIKAVGVNGEEAQTQTVVKVIGA